MYCVYFHINPLKCEVFYVGIGKPDRPYSDRGRSMWWHRTVKKYGKMIYVIHNGLTREQACQLEIYYIKKIGRKDLGLGSLINMTNGGDGVNGRTPRKMTQIERKRRSKAMMNSDKFKSAMANPIRRANISQKLSGRTLSDEHRSKLSKSRRNKQISEELVSALTEGRRKSGMYSKGSERNTKLSATLKEAWKDTSKRKLASDQMKEIWAKRRSS